MRRRSPVVLAAVVVLTALLATPGAIAQQEEAGDVPARPSRVLVLVIDGMRSDYIDRFGLPNLTALRDGGVSFTRSQVGYMASITVISHNVIASGLLPSHQGWSDEILRDVDNRLGGGAGALYVMSSASCSDFALLATGYPKLGDYLGALEADGDARMYSVATKDRSACGVGQPADANDVVIGMARLSSPGITCDGVTQRWRFPRGVNVPASMAAACSRFYVDSLNDYGTATTSPAQMYPLDGNRFVTGFDPTRQGGDVWSTDAAIELMQTDFADADDDDWRGLFVGLGGADKMAHMWGPDDSVTGPEGSVDDMIHLPGSLETIDEQVGRLLAELEAEGLLEETLIVLSADHGMTQADAFYGIDGPGRGDFNWYFGAETGTRADESYLSPTPAITDLASRIGPNLAFSYQDTHVAVWLKDTSEKSRRSAAAAMRTLPGAVATFFLNPAQNVYVLDRFVGSTTPDELLWLKQNGKRLVSTMAAPYGPDAVALLNDRTTYSVEGDHGGHQRDIQFIPIVFSWPGLKDGVVDGTITNVDILPTILALLGIDPTHPLDGNAFPLPLKS
ncbi:MAG: alkaline phosphatase family protein [Actinobacteria bacterium]|nr:alkaline phosphatase family protein [Actinomycetota bacterium]